MNLSDSFRDTLLRVVNGAHKAVIAASGGRLGATAAGMPVVKLTTTGRTSGLPRTVMLTTPIQTGDRHVLVASKGGDDRHPDWYRNLVANPEITLDPVGGDGPITLHARTATDAEADEMWPEIIRVNDGYAGYKQKTDRSIPIVICEPPA